MYNMIPQLLIPSSSTEVKIPRIPFNKIYTAKRWRKSNYHM